mmetsp:Transcript_104819/g.321066  ORF Transcript_104819/g.321066 Transcript_104819/m.321066 type:complete len:225 (-) Transcript_104819:832-1506(-)
MDAVLGAKPAALHDRADVLVKVRDVAVPQYEPTRIFVDLRSPQVPEAAFADKLTHRPIRRLRAGAARDEVQRARAEVQLGAEHREEVPGPALAVPPESEADGALDVTSRRQSAITSASTAPDRLRQREGGSDGRRRRGVQALPDQHGVLLGRMAAGERVQGPPGHQVPKPDRHQRRLVAERPKAGLVPRACQLDAEQRLVRGRPGVCRVIHHLDEQLHALHHLL